MLELEQLLQIEIVVKVSKVKLILTNALFQIIQNKIIILLLLGPSKQVKNISDHSCLMLVTDSYLNMNEFEFKC